MSDRFYHLTHTAHYQYPTVARFAYGRLTITPRTGGGQHVLASRTVTDPESSRRSTRPDYHRNTCTYVQFDSPHSELRISAESVVRVSRKTSDPARLPTVSWEQAAQSVRTVLTPEGLSLTGNATAALAVAESRLASPLIDLTDEVRDFALGSFAPGQPLIEAIMSLAGRMAKSFTVIPLRRTQVDGMLSALRTGRGTIKDLAHLLIGCARSMGLSARYLTGYVARDGGALHSWVSIWVPGGGWVHVDPSTGELIDHRYIVLGWGRDTWDVIPLRGVVFGDQVGIRPKMQITLEEVSQDEAAELAIQVRTSTPHAGGKPGEEDPAGRELAGESAHLTSAK